MFLLSSSRVFLVQCNYELAELDIPHFYEIFMFQHSKPAPHMLQFKAKLCLTICSYTRYVSANPKTVLLERFLDSQF